MAAKRALVIGGSIGGLLSALLLRKAGWDVAVYERAVGDLAGRGAGLGVSRELLEILALAGAPFEPGAGAPQEQNVWMDRDGSVRFEHRRNLMASAWARVYRPLRAALPAECYRQGMALTSVEEGSGAVVAHFADGSRAEGDLLVGADGVYSTVRRQFLPDVKPAYANYVAWRGLVEQRDLPAETLRMLDGRLAFLFPPNEMMLTMLAPAADEDARRDAGRVYFIWYRQAGPRGIADLFTDANGKHHGIAIPPPLVRREFVDELKAHAHAALPAPIAAVIDTTAQPLLQAVTDMVSPRMTFGRVALLGDAAFVVRPHVAGGAGKAAMDARTLADALVASGGDVERALAVYETSQHEFGRRIVEHSRYLGTHLEGRAGHGPPLFDPTRIIRDYGAPALLHDVEPWQIGRAG